MNLKKLKYLSIIVIPDDTSTESKSFKLSLNKILLSVILYTLLIIVLLSVVYAFTPAGKILGSPGFLTESEKEKIENLSKRIISLSVEMERLKSFNRQLAFAAALGDTSLVDSLMQVNDSLYQKKKNMHVDGNLWMIIKKIIPWFQQQDEQTIFFIKPAEGFISRKFNPSIGHFGIDYACKVNTPVYAAASGYVLFADYTTSYGYTIIVSHPHNFITVYKHCSSLLKKVRETVKQGELIALTGNVGTTSEGPHLHFEIWKDGQAIDPLNLIINFFQEEIEH